MGGRPEVVGRVAENRYVTPTGQVLTPAGQQIELPWLRPQALAVSPDGKLVVTSGRTNRLVVMDAATGHILQNVSLATNKLAAMAEANAEPSAEPGTTPELPPTAPAGTNTNTTVRGSSRLSFTGLTFAPDGRRIYLSGVSGTLRVFPVDKDHQVGIPFPIKVPDARAPGRREEIPCGLTVSADSKRLYVVGNLGNKLHEIEAGTGKVLRSWDTGLAPFDVVLVGEKAYVSNEGGRRPGKGDLTAPAGKGTRVRVDPVRHIPNEGSVTVVDLADGTVKSEIMVELHPSALAVSPNRRYVVVANTGSDTLSVIDTKTDTVVEKIWARQTPADLFGAQPNALAFDRSGKQLFVCNGTQNAVAVVQFEPEDNASKVTGLIPVGWFPGAVEYDPAHKSLWVANIKGIGAVRATRSAKSGGGSAFNSKNFFGTVSRVPLPSKPELEGFTQIALQNMRYPKLAEAKLPPRPDQPPRPVPERVGEPSVFKHVIYVIKENRCYDQVLGDMKEGNGLTNLCVFGERYTPNQHKIAREFVLLDNTYCSGVQSADGHQWTDSALANAYVERQLTADFPRSYPGGKTDEDALAWASSGFIWDNALAHGKTFRNYGEWMISQVGWTRPPSGGGPGGGRGGPGGGGPGMGAPGGGGPGMGAPGGGGPGMGAPGGGGPGGRGFGGRGFGGRGGGRGGPRGPGWQDFWNDYKNGTNATRIASRPAIETLRKYSPTNTVGWDLKVPDVVRAAFFTNELRQFEINGGFPDLIILFLPNDHTGGTRWPDPTPGSQVADNDLAFGQVVEALSHSKFWPETCLLAIEDDPQDGWDHVSGYRTACYIVSPYTKRKQTISTQYNQTSLLRTLELILGLPPMNQMDATATPMSDCFMDKPDLTPFSSVTNRVPLDRFNPQPRRIADRVLRRDAEVSASLPLDEPDRCPEDVLNRILWRAMMGTAVPYPEWAVKAAVDND
jgi:YVTN family beta-propeller protein